jgi:hypothetical protein
MTTQTIKWRKQWHVARDRIVWVIVAKFNECWRRSEDGDQYLVRGQGRHGTYEYLERAVKNGTVLGMPHVSFYSDLKRISFTDGRHRFSWFVTTVAAQSPSQLTNRAFH